ncbi:MAG: protein kinase family protein [Gemmatimonadota bacterium]
MNGSGGWSAWKAIDETLARPVAVLTFAPGFPRVQEVVTAARAASRLTDARLAQVFDVEDNWDQAYVVMEWVSTDSLDDLLAEGPLDPARCAEIIAEGAEALSSAHAAGLAHLCLTPGSLRWSPVGGVKIAGVGIDAALAGASADDPAQADTMGLGRLLYAALTATWPGTDWPSLPPAPEIDGRPRAPHQVRAGVPAALDDIACQAMFLRERRGGDPPLDTPAMLADALVDAMPAPMLPPPAPAARGGRRGGDYDTGYPADYSTGYDTGYGHSGYDADDDGTASRPGPGPGYWNSGPEPGRGGPFPPSGRGPGGHGPGGRSRTPLIVGAVVTVLIVGAVLIAARGLGGHGSPQAQTGGKASQSASPAANKVAVLAPASAHGFDALSPPSQDSGNENDNQAQFTIDNNPKSAWQSQYYFGSPAFGGLKTGSGLILDMNSPVHLSSVQVTFGPIPGADVSIEVGNSNVRDPATLHSFTPVAQASDIPGGTFTFHAHGTATGRYVLIWFTKLPPRTAGSQKQFMAEIFNIVVRGSH